MIVLNVTYQCKPGMREKFLEAIKAEGLDDACRAEEGNCLYSYYFAAEDPDEMILVEKWKDAEILAKHNTMPHFKRIGEIKPKYVDAVRLEKYFTED